jgi:hypothetical protein
MNQYFWQALFSYGLRVCRPGRIFALVEFEKAIHPVVNLLLHLFSLQGVNNPVQLFGVADISKT